jgi:hypothetical protein
VLAFGRQGVAVQPPPAAVDTTVGAPSGPPSPDGTAREADR